MDLYNEASLTDLCLGLAKTLPPSLSFSSGSVEHKHLHSTLFKKTAENKSKGRALH